MMDRHEARVILLTTAHTYRAEAFRAAAERLGIEVVPAVDMPPALAQQWDLPLGIPFGDVPTAVQSLVDYAHRQPVNGILPVDDSGTLLAAAASAALGLPHNDPQAALAARDKYVMRQMLNAAGVPCPPFCRFPISTDPHTIAAQVAYPCVVKPLTLSGSRGVIRADDPITFEAAFHRTAALIRSLRPDEDAFLLVEEFIPGFEVALEGLLHEGELQVLALFDKPDPLDGPFFEETIYVTPSRLPPETQAAIANCAAQAAQALGLRQGPVHAELRVNSAGPWLVEVAGRSIGGLCSQILRFGMDVSLEELILRQLCRLPIASFAREIAARGVMMIPIPQAGLLRGVTGVAAALAVPGVEGVEITARLNYPLTPLPEGESYLGFIFARAEMPAAAETALREAHRCLSFQIDPLLPLLR